MGTGPDHTHRASHLPPGASLCPRQGLERVAQQVGASGSSPPPGRPAALGDTLVACAHAVPE